MTNTRQKRVKKDLIKESETNKSENFNQKFKLGDLTWVKIRDSAWWPAQVVDEETVSNKPKKKSKDVILCRLYGTYEYVYVDAWKSNIEFEDVLKKENKSIKDKFQEVVNEDISLMKLKVKSKSKASKSKDIDIADASKGKMEHSNLPRESTKSISATRKKQDSFKGKRKLDFCEEKKKETNPISESSKKKSAISTNKQKITNQEDSRYSPRNVSKESEKVSSPTKSEFSNGKTLITEKIHKTMKNLNNEASRRSPRNFPQGNSGKISSAKTKIVEISTSKLQNTVSNSVNEEEMKAKDIEIRQIVRDILYGGINIPKKDENPKKDSNAKSKNVKSKGKVEKKSGKKKVDLKGANLNPNDDEKMIKSVGVKGGIKKNETKNSINLGVEEKETVTPLSGRVVLVPEEKGSLNERKIRVMQSLALIAPLGSPFGKSGLVHSSSLI